MLHLAFGRYKVQAYYVAISECVTKASHQQKYIMISKFEAMFSLFVLLKLSGGMSSSCCMLAIFT